MSNYGWLLPLLLLAALLFAACQPVMPVEANTVVEMESADSETETSTPAWDEIFVINRFASSGFDRDEEFVCHIGVDCMPGDVPFGLGSPSGYKDEVPQLTLVFELSNDYSELVLHLRRAGSETTSISVDGGEPWYVTSEMLGSKEGGVTGSYDLALGPLQSGSHSITFSVPDDGKGNGTYAWAAVSLTAR